MTRIIPAIVLLGIGFALLGGCRREGPDRSAEHAAIQRLGAENQQLREQNARLHELHAQVLSELKVARRSADRADVAVRTSYLALAPVASVLMMLGTGLAVMVLLVVRRHRRPGG